jgi:hypothetical protein
VTRHEHGKLLHQIKELCTFLPALSEGRDFARLRLIYEQGGTHMLDSENAKRLVETAQEHVRELRKLARLFAMECRLNLAQRSPRK